MKHQLIPILNLISVLISSISKRNSLVNFNYLSTVIFWANLRKIFVRGWRSLYTPDYIFDRFSWPRSTIFDGQIIRPLLLYTFTYIVWASAILWNFSMLFQLLNVFICYLKWWAKQLKGIHFISRTSVTNNYFFAFDHSDYW